MTSLPSQLNTKKKIKKKTVLIYDIKILKNWKKNNKDVKLQQKYKKKN